MALFQTTKENHVIKNSQVGYHDRLVRKLYEATLAGKDTDVVLVFGQFGKDAPTLHVHSSILKAESSVFKTWMNDPCWNGEFIKSADGKTMISLPADDPQHFGSFLKLMYGQKGLIKKDKMHIEAIPAFQIADKYAVLDVMKICEKDCFPAIIKNLGNLNVAQVSYFAEKYGVTSITNAVLKFVKKNPKVLIKGEHAVDWARFGEGVLVRLLSTDSYVMPFVAQSESEFLLCQMAIRWLKNKRALAFPLLEEDKKKTEKCPSSSKQPRVIKPCATTIRVLQNIRFLQLTPNQLRRCIMHDGLHELLTPHQIGTITLVRSGISQYKIEPPAEGQEFIVNTKLRFPDS